MPSAGGKLGFSGSLNGTVISVGTDGLALDVPFSSSSSQQLLAAVGINDQLDLLLLLEVHWQRRTGLQQWQIGAIIHDIRQLERKHR